jgi:hypothetical protein
VKVKVARVDQSPVNEKRWCLELACGHEAWVTSARRPTTKVYDCGFCSAKAVKR